MVDRCSPADWRQDRTPLEDTVIAALEKIFLSSYSGRSIMTQHRARVFLYFVLSICTAIMVISSAMVLLGVYGLFSIQAAIRVFLLILGIVGLVIMKNGRYYAAANIVVIGATLGIAVQILAVSHETPVELVQSIIIPYLFIITAALLTTRRVILATAVLTAVIGAAAVFMSDAVDPGAARKIVGLHMAMIVFISTLCFLIMNNMVSAIREVTDEMKRNMEQSSVIMKLLGRVQELSGTLSSSSSELSSTAMQFSDNTQNQASSVEEMTASIEEMAAGVDAISHSAEMQIGDMDRLVDKMKEFSGTIEVIKGQVASMLANASNSMKFAQLGNDNLELMNRSMANINSSSSEMTGIIKIIKDISDQINLLSLNAAIEAARAGDAGRGFAVVADEISKLADETSQSVKSIGSLISANEKEIEGGRGNVEKTVDTIGRIIEGVSANYKIMQELAERMDRQLEANEEINRDAMNVKMTTGEIKSATQEHKRATDEIVKTISAINEMTQANSAGAEETFSNTEELQAVATQLKDIVDSVDREG